MSQGNSVQDFDGFEDFFRGSYREVVKTAMVAGATQAEAEDAASRTFEDMLRRWPVTGAPLGYARKAVVHNFIKDKTRGDARTAQRLVERGYVLPSLERTEDDRLDGLEGHEWVVGILSYLTPAQHEVMSAAVSGLTTAEIAEDLGKSQAAIRRLMCDARARLVQVLNSDGTPVYPGPVTDHLAERRSHERLESRQSAAGRD